MNIKAISRDFEGKHQTPTYRSTLRDPRGANCHENVCKTLLKVYPCTRIASGRVQDNPGSISLRVPILGYFLGQVPFQHYFWYQEKKFAKSLTKVQNRGFGILGKSPPLVMNRSATRGGAFPEEENFASINP